MTAVSGSLSAANQRGTSFRIDRPGLFNATCDATSLTAGYAMLQRSFDNGTTWYMRSDFDGFTRGARWSSAVEEPEAGMLYSVVLSSDAVGTVTYRLSQ